MEINYLDKRNPVLSAMWSLFVPGLGQLYLHRIVTAFFVIIWTVIFFYFSHLLEAVTLLFLGEVKQATSVLDAQWLLFLPSTYGFAVFDSYINTVEYNKLFEKEQRKFLIENYQHPRFRLLKGKKVK